MSDSHVPQWPSRALLSNRLSAGLTAFDVHTPLPGIAATDAHDTLVKQMVASVRRLDYTNILLNRPLDPARADPSSELFDPEKAAILHMRAGQMDEAIWLIFLSTHFGKHPRHGWRMVRDVYSGLGGTPWNWERASRSPAAFRAWLSVNGHRIGGAFGNHRRYESINANRPNGTGEAVETYIAWIGPSHSHRRKFAELVLTGGNDPHSIFECFYEDMQVTRFGRLGKFDFLCLLGRLGLAPIAPGCAYLRGATGPLRGARLLFGGCLEAPIKEAHLEDLLCGLDRVLEVGMQVLEDSICNWQKSPTLFVHFKG